MSFKASQPAIASPDGLYVVVLIDNNLVVRFSRATTEEIPERTIPLPSDFASNAAFFRWSSERLHEPSKECGQHRLLVADSSTIRIWDLVNKQWSTKIDNAGGSFGKLAQVYFGIDGNEVIGFSDFGVRLNIWSLRTGHCVEIKDPKYTHIRGFGYRPKTGHFTILSRPMAFDTITLHAPGTYEAISSLTLPTVDAQGLKWSADGHWLAVWDSSSAGCKVVICTADGQLYRTYNGDEEEEMDGLGVKTLEWCPVQGYLAVSRFNNKVTLLSAKTFSPIVTFDHTSMISVPSVQVWQEHVSASKEHTYSVVSQPAYPPTATASSDPIPRTGISILSFSKDGLLMATKNDTMPTTVWIWSVQSLKPIAVLIHHSHVKQLSWHPTNPGLLLITCNVDESIIYQWSSDWDHPRAAFVPLAYHAKLASSWLATDAEDQALVLATSPRSYTIGFVESNETKDVFVSICGSKAIDSSPEKNNAGPSPTKNITDFFDEALDQALGQHIDSFSGSIEDVDDTFHYRKYVPVQG